MKKLPFLIVLAALSGMHISAYAEDNSANKDTTTETKPATGETTSSADAKPAEGDKKSGGDDEPDCN